MAKQKKTKKKKQHRVFWFFIKLQIFLMVLILGGLCFYYFGGYADKVAKLHSEAVELVQKSDKNTFLPARTSTLYDTNGDEISETATTKKADYVKYEDIPQNFVNCMVSIEDKKFYKHNGVDLKAIVRAAKSIIKNKRITQGGSTITMQLARNIYLDTNKNWQRKVKEMFIAMELEKKYSKNDIMEFYLNNVYFMNGYYGIQAACHGYFNCELSDLDLSQTAFLCAIPNSPTYYDPINNKEHTLTRRNLILKNLKEDGNEIIHKLIEIQYDRNDMDFKRGTFRVRGENLEIFPASYTDSAIRVEFFDDEIERISEIDALTGQIKNVLEHVAIFPNSHYVVPPEKMERAIKDIEKELEEQVAYFKSEDKLIEAQRIAERSEERRVGKECRSRWSPYH